MVEVVFAYHGFYPFGRQKESENTFMQVIKSNLRDDDINLLRQKSKILRSITSPYIIKHIKMLKEESKLYFVYEYEPISLEMYIDLVKKSMEGSFSRDKYKLLVAEFKNNTNHIIDVLMKAEIKADIQLSSIGCVPRKQPNEMFLLKVFVDPDAEYLSLIQHNYKANDSKKKDRTGINQQYLTQFYQAERKRLILDFQELLEAKFGKFQEVVEKKQYPNFVINGTKLVFLSSEDKDNQHNENQGRFTRLEMLKMNQIKERDSFRIQQSSKNVKVQQKTITPHFSQPNINSFVSKSKQEQYIKNVKSSHPQMPIIDFDQSFEPQFKPEQFLKEKTYIYEETDYLKSLQEELDKMAVEKVVEKKSHEPKKCNIQMQKRKQYVKNQKEIFVKKLENITQKAQRFDKKDPKGKDLTISQGSTAQSNPHNRSNKSNENTSNNDSYEKKNQCKQLQVKGQKMNKYKMTIITSHQIEIQNGSEDPNVEQIEKEIVEGIRTGKININELGTYSNQKMIGPIKYESDQTSKDNSSYVPGLYKSDHKEERRIIKDINTSSTQQLHKIDRSKHSSEGYQQKEPNKYRETQISRLKSINQIIQKIGIRPNTNGPHTPEQHTESYSTHKTFPHPQYATVSHSKFQKNERAEHGQHNEQGDEKNQRTQNYLNKVKEAKSKAQQILRQYTKKKQ